jgi:hypothetical protein
MDVSWTVIADNADLKKVNFARTNADRIQDSNVTRTLISAPHRDSLRPTFIWLNLQSWPLVLPKLLYTAADFLDLNGFLKAGVRTPIRVEPAIHQLTEGEKKCGLKLAPSPSWQC